MHWFWRAMIALLAGMIGSSLLALIALPQLESVPPTAINGLIFVGAMVALGALVAWPLYRRHHPSTVQKRLLKYCGLGISLSIGAAWLVSFWSVIWWKWGTTVCWRTLRIENGYLHLAHCFSNARSVARVLVAGQGQWAGPILPTAWYSHTEGAPWSLSRAFIIAAIPTAFLFWLDRRRIPKGQCQKCSYSLIGNTSGVCPECGTAIDVPDKTVTG